MGGTAPVTSTSGGTGREPSRRAAPSSPPGPPDPALLLRDPKYVGLLVFGALVGAPIAFLAYFYLRFVSQAQNYLFSTLPKELGFSGTPVWWPILPLMMGGLLVALALSLPGTGGHKPAEGFKAGGANEPINLPGIIVASLATLCFGVVLGPEAPLIAIGGGLGVLALHLVKKDAVPMAAVVIGGAGSFAAIATLLGLLLAAAFLLMEAVGVGGPLLGLLLVPGLLAAGVGALIFVGLDSWTGFGTFSLSVSHIPALGSPSVGEFLWAIVIGVVAALIGAVIKRGALALQPVVEKKKVLLTPVVVGVSLLVILFTQVTGKPSSFVLYSGQNVLPTLIHHAAAVQRRGLGALDGLQGRRLRPLAQQLPRGPSSRACSSGPRSASPSPTCPGCPWWPGSAWASGR